MTHHLLPTKLRQLLSRDAQIFEAGRRGSIIKTRRSRPSTLMERIPTDDHSNPSKPPRLLGRPLRSGRDLLENIDAEEAKSKTVRTRFEIPASGVDALREVERPELQITMTVVEG